LCGWLARRSHCGDVDDCRPGWRHLASCGQKRPRRRPRRPLSVAASALVYRYCLTRRSAKPRTGLMLEALDTGQSTTMPICRRDGADTPNRCVPPVGRPRPTPEEVPLCRKSADCAIRTNGERIWADRPAWRRCDWIDRYHLVPDRQRCDGRRRGFGRPNPRSRSRSANRPRSSSATPVHQALLKTATA
jgi:hypothetical protein